MTERATVQTATPFTQAEWQQIESLVSKAISQNRGPKVPAENVRVIMGGFITKVPLGAKTIIAWLANTENVYQRTFQKRFFSQWIPNEEIEEGLPVAYIGHTGPSNKIEYALIALATPEQKQWISLRPNFDCSRFRQART